MKGRGGIVLNYPVPSAAPAKPSPYQRKSRARRKNRGWIKFHVAELEVEEVKALARCYGVTFDWFVRYCLHRIRCEIERKLGINGRRALELTPIQRVQLAGLVLEVRDAVSQQGDISGAQN
jgi:hypothetical protein